MDKNKHNAPRPPIKGLHSELPPVARKHILPPEIHTQIIRLLKPSELPSVLASFVGFGTELGFEDIVYETYKLSSVGVHLKSAYDLLMLASFVEKERAGQIITRIDEKRVAKTDALVAEIEAQIDAEEDDAIKEASLARPVGEAASESSDESDDYAAQEPSVKPMLPFPLGVESFTLEPGCPRTADEDVKLYQSLLRETVTLTKIKKRPIRRGIKDLLKQRINAMHIPVVEQLDLGVDQYKSLAKQIRHPDADASFDRAKSEIAKFKEAWFDNIMRGNQYAVLALLLVRLRGLRKLKFSEHIYDKADFTEILANAAVQYRFGRVEGHDEPGIGAPPLRSNVPWFRLLAQVSIRNAKPMVDVCRIPWMYLPSIEKLNASAIGGEDQPSDKRYKWSAITLGRVTYPASSLKKKFPSWASTIDGLTGQAKAKDMLISPDDLAWALGTLQSKQLDSLLRENGFRKIFRLRVDPSFPDALFTFYGSYIESPLKILHLQNSEQIHAMPPWFYTMPHLEELKLAGESRVEDKLWRMNSLKRIKLEIPSDNEETFPASLERRDRWKYTQSNFYLPLLNTAAMTGEYLIPGRTLSLEELDLPWVHFINHAGPATESFYYEYRFIPSLRVLKIRLFDQCEEGSLSRLLQIIVQYFRLNGHPEISSSSSDVDVFRSLERIEVHYREGKTYSGSLNHLASLLWRWHKYHAARKLEGRQLMLQIFDENHELITAQDWVRVHGHNNFSLLETNV